MYNELEISKRRWFMGKNKKIKELKEFDSIQIGNSYIHIIKVIFEDLTFDLYATLNENSAFNEIGNILSNGFSDNCTKVFKGKNGDVIFYNFAKNSSEILQKAIPLNVEQSNSAFFVNGKFFFKMYRRLQAGTHPEQEIMQQLHKARFSYIPKFLGYSEYVFAGNKYALGILEEHVSKANSAWDIFINEANLDSLKALSFALGTITANMHLALKSMKGSNPKPEIPPFDKLLKLLKNSDYNFLQKDIESLQIKYENLALQKNSLLKPQRIHGDYHLGQLLYNGKNFIILDFEGEPSRTLEFRSMLRSPAADIAGMLRSFAYVACTRYKTNKDADNFSQEFEQTMSQEFLKGYSQISNISESELLNEIKPYILSKAVYEACYELEFRPTWFWIPQKALLKYNA